LLSAGSNNSFCNMLSADVSLIEVQTICGLHRFLFINSFKSSKVGRGPNS
jgi:hypothetical protein